MPNANSFPDGQRGKIRSGDVSRVADYSASTLPVGGPGMLRRRFPQGSTCFPLPTACKVPKSALTPFELVQGTLDGDGNIQPAPATNSFVFNPASYFRADATASDYTNIDGLDSALPLSDGMLVWLEINTEGSTGNFDEVGINSGSTAPYDGSGQGANGTSLINFSGSGTAGDPYVWDQSFVPLAQVFAASSADGPQYGGIIYTVDTTTTPPTQIEVVQQTSTNQALRPVFVGGRYGMMAFPDSAPLISDSSSDD